MCSSAPTDRVMQLQLVEGVLGCIIEAAMVFLMMQHDLVYINLILILRNKETRSKFLTTSCYGYPYFQKSTPSQSSSPRKGINYRL